MCVLDTGAFYVNNTNLTRGQPLTPIRQKMTLRKVVRTGHCTGLRPDGWWLPNFTPGEFLIHGAPVVGSDQVGFRNVFQCQRMSDRG